MFASLVDDPSNLPEEFPTEEAQEKERQRLFRIIEELVKWENSNNEEVLGRARAEIMRSTGGNPPPVLDPFCGGGSIPLEAQRLGLDAHGSDLNPVAILITKALIEIPPRFADRQPVNPDAKKKLTHSAKRKGAQGLAEDVRYYGRWMRDEAEKRIGHFYPKVKLDDGREAPAIAWLWARTVMCPNPACGAETPLLNSTLISRARNRSVGLQATPVEGSRRVSFTLIYNPQATEGNVGRTGAECLVCRTHITLRDIRAAGVEGRMASQLVCIVSESKQKFSSPTVEAEAAARIEAPPWTPSTSLPERALGFRVQNYGLLKHRDLFTSRQLLLLSTFLVLIQEAIEQASRDGADEEYQDALRLYLGLCLGRLVNRSSSQCFWHPGRDTVEQVFARNALPMIWVYAEGNPFSDSTGNYLGQVEYLASALEDLPATGAGYVTQRDARVLGIGQPVLICTDPPYYDNVPYADLSDFFYVWLREALKKSYPDLLSTLLVPKQQELIAEPARHASAPGAAEYFETGLRSVFERALAVHGDAGPFTVFYAFRQAGERGSESGRVSTGWETILQALLDSGWSINGTWPLRTEQPGGLRELGRNALASSVVLVCRQRLATAGFATRRQFIAALKDELPGALKNLQDGSIAAVDLAQAAIGPGMAVFSRYAKVIEADGSPMRVRSALQLINQALGEVLSDQESEYDADTQWAVAWFDQFGMGEAPFGEAETLSKAKNTSVTGLVESRLLRAAKGKVQLIGREQLNADWDPTGDRQLTIWEVTQHLIARLKSGGEQSAADLLRKVGGVGEIARDLAYRLYSICSSPRKGWTEEAIAYNSLVVAWPEITRLAAEGATRGDGGSNEQASLI